MSRVVHRAWYRVRAWGAIAPGTDLAERFGSFGRASIISFPPATIYGERHIHIGTEVTVGPWVTLAVGYVPDQPGLPDRALVIGDRCVVNMRSGITAHESVEVGDDVWFGQDVFVTDSGHGFADLDVPIGRQVGPVQPVRIGAGSWIGHGAVILPGATLGRHVVVAAGAVVRGEVPSYSVVAGVPAKIVRTFGPATPPDDLEALLGV